MPWSQKLPTRPFFRAFLGASVAVVLIVGILLGSIQLYHRNILQQQEVRRLYEILNRQIILNKEAGLLAQRLEVSLKSNSPARDVHQELLVLSTEVRQERNRLEKWMQQSSGKHIREIQQIVRVSNLPASLEELQNFTYQLARAESLRTRDSVKSLNFLTQDAQVTLTDLLNFLTTKVDHEYKVASQTLMVRAYWVAIPVGLILVITWLLIFRPMHSALRGRNDRLNEAVLRAEAASRSKIEFLANVSHEIRTPMTAILGYLDLVQQDQSVSPQSLSHLDIIDRNARHLLRLIDEILDVSKADAGKLQLNPSEAQLDEILFDIYSLLKIKAEERGIELIIEYDGPVPEVLYTDALRLKQVLFNIVGNAVKFTSQGFVKVVVSMEPRRRRLLRFDVKDTGQGIPKAHFSKLFKPFEQVDASSTRTSTGTGLGLVLSKKITEKLGGNLTLESSTPGVGTTFRISIAGGQVAADSCNLRKFPHSELTNNAIHHPSGMAPAGALDGRRILIVDDVVENGYLFQVYLEQARALPDFASSGAKALEMAKEKSYDLVLLDLQMPGMDGFTALEQLRALGFDKPIFALTAHAMSEERERALSAGFNGFITKPIRAKEFLETLEDHFRSREIRDLEIGRYSFS